MIIPEIIDAFKDTDGIFPLEAVEEAIAQQKAITPVLLRILEEDAENLELIAPQENYMAHAFAMYLLSQFREPRAFPLLINFFSKDKDLVNFTTGDIIADDLGRMLACTCNSDTTIIKQVIEDDNRDEYVRSAALSALVVLVKEGVILRDEAMGYIKELFNGKIKREYNFLWTFMVAVCCDMYPEDLLPEIEQAFDDDLIDVSFIGDIDDVNDIIDEGRDVVLTEFMDNNQYRFINDTIEEMDFWGCFKENDTEWDECDDIMDSDNIKNTQDPFTFIPKKPAPVVTLPKVGRNDPCPCGSGEKYKRCCG
jgi:hypothetical protein